MQTVAIIGVGLIGGSFGLALKKAGFDGRILGVSSRASLDTALERGAIDEAATLEQAVPRADLVYLSQTITRILETIARIDPLLRSGSLVTDAGSTKKVIVTAAGAKISRAQFLGGHPMAGREARGAAAAAANLFEGRPYVLTPQTRADLETPAARDLLEWLRRIGAKPLVLDPEEHDHLVAFTSHLPQLASTALGALLAAQPDCASTAGPGLLDMTRLGLSSFEVWRDILATNGGNIGPALDAYIAKLQELRARLDNPVQEFDAAARFATDLRRQR